MLTIEMHNLDGNSSKRTHVYTMPVISAEDYWRSVTDVACPIKSCDGVIRWHEAGYVPGYRICNRCKRHFLAKGSSEHPKLARVGLRRG